MSLTTSCGIALAISMLIILVSIVLCIYKYVSYMRSDVQSSKYILTSLQIMVIGSFLALVTIFFPVYYVDYFAEEHGFLTVLKSILLSIQNTLQVYTLNAVFDGFNEFFKDPERVNQALRTVYTFYASVLYVLAPALVATFILSLFSETSARIKYALRIGADIYLFSELNERSITLAKDIKINPDLKGKKVIVFAGVQKKDGDECVDLLERAKRLGAICFKQDITNVRLKRAYKNIKRKLYFINENEDDNISNALDVIKECLKYKNLNSQKTELYIFAASVESETLINSTNIGNVKVRRVNDNKNLVWQTLRHNSVFEDADAAYPDSEDRKLNIAVVGCGNYGTELLKALCWLGQMPKYSLSIHVFDKDANVEEKVRCIAPELIARNGIMQDGESQYSLYFYPNTDVTGSSFINELSKIGRVTSVFITLGSDILNVDTAIRIRTEFLRHKGYSETRPSIYPVVYSRVRSATADNGSKLVISSRDDEISYNLKFIGGIDARYSVENIEQTELEKTAQSYHLIWAKRYGNQHAVYIATKKFDKYEYYRSSSIAQAIYIEYLKKLKASKKIIFEAEDKVLFNEYEHRRWNAYMRAEGYVYAEDRYDLAKMHKDLKPFDELSDEDKAKDEVWSIAINQK